MSDNTMRLFKFPAGEVHIKGIVENMIDNTLFVPYGGFESNLNDWIMEILLVTDMLKAKMKNPHELSLFIPYLPYSRQDRRTSSLEPFSLKVLGDILNIQNYKKVYTLDVHSDVAAACVNNLVNIPIDYIVPKMMDYVEDQVLIIPDQGAYKRLYDFSENWFDSSAIAIKHRDTNTGALSVKAVIGDVRDKACIIVDDICDGGGTFVLLAQKLKELGAKSVELYVTHGIFSKGVDVLFGAGISQIYTTSSFRNFRFPPDPKIKVLQVFDVFKEFMNVE